MYIYIYVCPQNILIKGQWISVLSSPGPPGYLLINWTYAVQYAMCDICLSIVLQTSRRKAPPFVWDIQEEGPPVQRKKNLPRTACQMGCAYIGRPDLHLVWISDCYYRWPWPGHEVCDLQNKSWPTVQVSMLLQALKVAKRFQAITALAIQKAQNSQKFDLQ